MTDDDQLQVLTFELVDETFAIEITHVGEVLELTPVTHAPHTEEYLMGVINLRGAVVPVVDLSVKFGLSSGERTVDTGVIIVEVVNADEESLTWVVKVDRVKEVMQLDRAGIEPPPRIGTSLDTDNIMGLSKQGDQFIILLAMDRSNLHQRLTPLTLTPTDNR
ncbi:chemotaxis protein CheW [Magnetococcales bacterium HHB-1]